MFLLRFIVDFIVRSRNSTRVKWVVSSRDWPYIEEELNRTTHKVILCLEQNKPCISEAVGFYIRYKVNELAKLKQYNPTVREAIHNHLVSNAEDTFLWVALVCQALGDSKAKTWKIRQMLLERFPPGLDSLYDRMIDQAIESEEPKEVLATMSIAYRPLSLTELPYLVKSLGEVAGDFESLEDSNKSCGSFLTLQEGVVFFVHQSAKDYLLQKAADRIFNPHIEDEHRNICSTSLHILSKTLQENIYSLDNWGIPPEKVKPPNPDPLAAVRYSCVYWVDHLTECRPEGQAQCGYLQDNGIVHKFLEKHYHHWLEALSILQSVPNGIMAMLKLYELLQVST